MKWLYYSFGIILLFSCQTKTAPPAESTPISPVIVVHGGAGYLTAENLNDSMQALYHDALHQALQEGYLILESGGTAVEAVEAAIRKMEDNPHFNAGKGSVLNAQGEVENDASIMDGTTLEAGAVAGVQNVKNPISLAQLVKDSSQHVMLSGDGAFQFALQLHQDTVLPSYFMTPQRAKQRQEILDANKKFGTVGCVALDADGNIAAGTSTGGMMHKKFGRIGDSPIIAAGTYANSHVAGVSCTGHGEYFIKNVVAYDVIARMNYLGEDLYQATEFIVNDKLVKQSAAGGLIALDKVGNVHMVYNTPGMFRGFMKSDSTFTGLF